MASGPITLFDKSALQSLNADESTQGRRFQVDDQDGAFYENPPEMVAFARWQRGDFNGQ